MADRGEVKSVMVLAMVVPFTVLSMALGTQQVHSGYLESRISEARHSESRQTNYPERIQSKFIQSHPHHTEPSESEPSQVHLLQSDPSLAKSDPSEQSQSESDQVDLSQSEPEMPNSSLNTTTQHSSPSVYILHKQLKSQEQEEKEERVELNLHQESHEGETTTNNYKNDEMWEKGIKNEKVLESEAKMDKLQTTSQEKNDSTRRGCRTSENKSKNIKIDERDSKENGEAVDKAEQGREHKLVSFSDSCAASLLMDIRDAMREKEQDRASDDSVELRLTRLQAATEDSINSMKTNFGRLRENMDQKVSLMMETFSLLKLLVLSQGEQLQGVLERLHIVENKVENSVDNIKDIHKSLDSIKTTLNISQSHVNGESTFVNTTALEEDHSFGLPVNVTEISAHTDSNTSLLGNLTSQVQEMKHTIQVIQQDLQHIPTNVFDFATMSASPATPPDSLPNTDRTNTNSTSCQCLDSDLKSSITGLQEAQEQQEREIDKLIRNMTTGERQEEKWNYSHRLGEVNVSSADMNYVRNTITSMQDDLINLKEKLRHSTNFSSSTSSTTSSGNATESVQLKGKYSHNILVFPARNICP